MRVETRSEVTVDSEGMRVDQYVASVMQVLPRSQFARHELEIRINQQPSKLSRKVRALDVVDVSYEEIAPPAISPEKLDLDILYEDEDVVVINKEQGMVVHPAAGNWTGTLAQGLLHHVKTLGESNTLRPGIVHRLDKDTSGVLIAAKRSESLDFLAAQFSGRSVEKQYLAVVKGAPPRSTGTVVGSLGRDPKHRKRFAVVPAGGKPAETEYRILRRYPGYCFVSLHPKTGRTHQLRVHASHIRCPILGDPLYARPDRAFPDIGLMLHAYRLTIDLPNRTTRTFCAPLPDRFKTVLRSLADLR